jgi:glycosyltransferase involved in cell wall biosynthesis
MSKKIAFIRKSLVPLPSVKLQQALQDTFPEFQVDLFDITEILKTKKGILITNGIVTLKEYGFDTIRNKRKFKDCFFRTSYIYHKIKALMSEYLDSEDYIFSVQMQSLYDASKPGLPHFIYTDHTNLANLSYPDFKQSTIYPSWWLDLEQKIYANATLVFTRSNNISRSIVEQYHCSPDKVICVYAGSTIKAKNLPDGKDYTNKNILFVGIDWCRKGGPELIEAFKIVLKVHPQAHLTIVGCSPKVDVPNCTIVGRLPLEKVSAYYEKASIFCMPTKLEPFGIVFLEALAYKLPIVATNIGAIPDFVIPDKNGYLVPPGNVEELAKALITLLDSPRQCEVFGEAGYKIITTNYTWANTGALLKKHICAALS